MADTLDDARAALARHDWAAARDLALAALDDAPDDVAAVEILAESTWWTGRLEECVGHRERAFTLHEALGDVNAAALQATTLVQDYGLLGKPAVAMGWLSRARRILEGCDRCVAYGHLLLRESEFAHGQGDLDRAIDIAGRAIAIGRDDGDRDLEALAVSAMARMRIDRGDIADGMALFDEVMLSAVEGKLSPLVTGKTYCSMLSACDELGDVRRATEWMEMTARWAENHPFSAFPGLCRVHRAELLRERGSWIEAEAEARLACDELRHTHVPSAGYAHYEVGEIRRRLGDFAGAEAAFREAEELGCGSQPGFALLHLAQGKIAAATAGIVQALAEQPWNRLARAKLLPARVQIAIAGGDLDAANAAADELSAIAATYNSPVIVATAEIARGRLALAAQDFEAAAGTLRRGRRGWQELDIPYEIATANVLLALAHRQAGNDGAADDYLDAADTIFRRLGAALDTKAVASLRSSTPATALPDGLTEREAEVLRLVAEGGTNKDVARTLHLSEKTVARHLSNIFVKTGVTSRSAATAYAYDRGLVAP
jgi:ATP/maltotriose-dependent transcriptional regulator MalT